MSITKPKTIAALLFALAFTVNGFAQMTDAQIPVIVNVNADVKITPPPGAGTGTGDEGAVTGGTQRVFNIKITELDRNTNATWGSDYTEQNYTGNTSVSHRGQRQTAGAWVSRGRSGVNLSLRSQQFDNAVISLHSVNGRQILSSKIAASNGASSISRSNIPAGVYLLSVKGTNGNSFSTRLTHSGKNLNINVAFVSTDNHLPGLSAAADDIPTFYGMWSITVSAPGYSSQTRSFTPKPGMNDLMSFEMAEPPAKVRFTETIGSTPFDMIYVEGGTFTLGCEQTSGCPGDTRAVSNVTVSSYFISETEVTRGLWWAVMGNSVPFVMTTEPVRQCWGMPGNQTCMGGPDLPVANLHWYHVHEFACRLSQLTGKNYRMPTEAEWEFAAKGGRDGDHSLRWSGSNTHGDVVATGCGFQGCPVKSREPNNLGIYDMSGSLDEWTYNSWSGTHSGGTDPTGSRVIHTQKTRRGGASNESSTTTHQVSARRIRSIEGADASIGIRLVLSADRDLPPGMVHPCNLHMPTMNDGDYVNTFRDMRWVTGDNFQWGETNQSPIKIWETGEAVIGGTPCTPGTGTGMNACPATGYRGGTVGEWYTVNNHTLKIAPVSGGTKTKYGYIFVTLEEASTIVASGSGFGSRLVKQASGSPSPKPIIASLRTLAELAVDYDDKMVDMNNIPGWAKDQDDRLFDGPNRGWSQGNLGGGATHMYRKDVDADCFRFIVYGAAGGADGVSLADGEWFTLNDIFLRVTYPDGFEVDYLYSVTGTGDSRRFGHVSFMDYERGDSRTFTLIDNEPNFPGGYNRDIPRGLTGRHVNFTSDHSTFQSPRWPCTGPNCGPGAATGARQRP